MKVESFSQLFNEFKNQDNFIACGPELVPLKPENVKRPAPSSNSGSDSMSVASRMKKFHKTNDDGIISHQTNYIHCKNHIEIHSSRIGVNLFKENTKNHSLAFSLL